MVKTYVMGHQHGALQQGQQLRGKGFKARCLKHHGIADAGQVLDEGRDRRAGIDQAAPACHFTAVLNAYCGNFGDAVMHRVATGGFQVKQKVAGQHGASRRGSAKHQCQPGRVVQHIDQQVATNAVKPELGER